MVAAFLQLNHGIAAVAFLPSSLLRRFNKLFGRRILRAVSCLVHFLAADSTHIGLASWTFTDFATLFHPNVLRLKPFATSTRWAVNLVFGLILFQLPIVVLLEVKIEKGVHVL